MKIATKLILFFGAVLVLFVLQAILLRQQTQTVTNGYDTLLSKPVHQMEMARVVQVNFKKQVQEWKDILLRGHTPEDLVKYTRQYHERESDVRAGAQALADALQDDPAIRDLVLQFLAAHKAMGGKYQAAYEAYLAGKFDFKTADSMVRGQDRAPTDLFDEVVRRLNTQMKASVDAQQVAVRKARTLTLTFFATLLFILGLTGFVTVRNILARLGRLKAVADRLSAADVNGLSIDVSGNDEIGEFGESMKGVRAAIEELTKLASAVVS